MAYDGTGNRVWAAAFYSVRNNIFLRMFVCYNISGQGFVATLLNYVFCHFIVFICSFRDLMCIPLGQAVGNRRPALFYGQGLIFLGI